MSTIPTTTTTKERPILFSGPMVNAILEGRKTQTRRIVKGVFKVGEPINYDCIKDWDGGPSRLDWAPPNWEICPYGVAGDHLWVRETWGLLDTEPSDGPEKATIGYRADGEDSAPNGRHQLWRPSIFMPRWASRITLEVTETRVERLQAITDSDAVSEGVRSFHNIPLDPVHARYPAGADRWSMEDPKTTGECLATPRWAFANYWNKLNEKRGVGWDSDPWLWVITFRRLEGNS